MTKLIRFPEGLMSETEWCLKHASRVEAVKRSWESYLNRINFNRMSYLEQKDYEDKLRKKAEQLEYRAWRNSTNSFYVITKNSYDTFLLANASKVC